MARGLSLLELVIMIAVVSLVISLSLPNLQSLYISTKVRALATELTGFLLLARSEAIWRNRTLWIHLTNVSESSANVSQSTAKSRLVLLLTNSEEQGQGEVIRKLDMERFAGLIFEWNYTSDKLYFTGYRGRVKSGSFYFYPVPYPNRKLRLTTSFGGNRVMICGLGASFYGYPKCR